MTAKTRAAVFEFILKFNFAFAKLWIAYSSNDEVARHSYALQ